MGADRVDVILLDLLRLACVPWWVPVAVVMLLRSIR